MTHRVAIVLALIAGLTGGRALAQEIFVVPVEFELPDAPLVVDLDAAGLDVVFDADAVSVLRAAGAPGAAIAVSSDGGTVVVRRAPRETEAGAASPGERLRLELVLDPALRLDIFGTDLDVVVAGRQSDPEAAETDGDEDLATEDESDEAEGGIDEINDGVAADPMPDPEDPHRLFFDVAASSVDLVGVAGASVTAVESYLHARDTRNLLALSFEGVTAEIAGHQGRLDLTSRDGEVTVSDPVGVVAPVMTGGSLILSDGAGQLEGRLIDALMRVEGWRGGRIAVAGSGAVVEARGLLGVRLELKGDRFDVTLEDLQGYLQADLAGGSLTASQVTGVSNVKAHDGVALSVNDFQGQTTLSLVESSARMVDAGLLKAEVKGGRFEVDGAQRLELTASGAEVVAGRIVGLATAEFTDARLDLDLWELAGSPSLNLKGATEARVRLRTPCTVKLGEVDLLAGNADVTGCDLHSQSLRRARQELRGVHGNRRIMLTVTMGEDSTLEVNGTP